MDLRCGFPFEIAPISCKAAAMDSDTPDLRGKFQQPPQAHVPTNWEPPHSPEAERCVLGSILYAPKDNAEEAIGLLVPEAFFDPRNRAIFQAIRELRSKQQLLDLVTLGQWLEDNGQLAQVGGPGYLAKLSTEVPTPYHLQSYAKIVQDKFHLRMILESCSKVVAAVQESPDAAQDAVELAERELLEITKRTSGDKVMSVQPVMMDAIESINARVAHKDTQDTGIASGFDDLDKLTSGFQPGQMVVFAARPGVGKTSFALNIAEHAAMELGKGVLIFSLEMTNMEIAMRLISSRSRVDMGRIKNGIINGQDQVRVTNAAFEISKSKMFFEDTGGLTLAQLKSSARRTQAKHGVNLIIIDYLQIMQTNTVRKDDNRQAQVAELSGGIKALAKELKLPIIVLCQLNRQSETRQSKQPMLADLRESGAIEQDADMVGLLYRPEMNNDENVNSDTGEATLDLAKNRSGPTGRIKLTFLKTLTRFENYSRAESVPEAEDNAGSDRGGSRRGRASR